MALHLNDILTDLVQRDGSDLHLKVGQPPFFRIYGRLTRTDYPTLTPELIRELIYAILSEEQIQRLERQRELDMAYELSGVSRFRVNLFHQQGNLGGVFRVISSRVRTIDDLGLPQVLKKIALLRRGLVLVTGPTGSGADTESFAEALLHVMRQNPDVILVGEMRDLETIALAITAAETGHLVFSTVHTIDAPQTIDRIIDAFEPDRQPQIRVQLSTTLQAVISQQLVPRCDRPGRVAAMEIMVVTPAIRTLIRQGRTDQIYSHVKAGAELGCQMLDDHLFQLVQDGIVSFEDAFMKCSNPIEFKARCLEANLISAEQAAAFATS
jgi:twitching motility protein PilT